MICRSRIRLYTLQSSILIYSPCPGILPGPLNTPPTPSMVLTYTLCCHLLACSITTAIAIGIAIAIAIGIGIVIGIPMGMPIKSFVIGISSW